MNSERAVRPPAPQRVATTSLERPFGVHFQLARWQSLVVIVSLPLVLLSTQLLAFQGAALVEGPARLGDPLTVLQIMLPV